MSDTRRLIKKSPAELGFDLTPQHLVLEKPYIYQFAPDDDRAAAIERRRFVEEQLTHKTPV